jgi:hypothetical protein
MFPIELTQVDDGIAPVDDLGPVIGCDPNADCISAIIRDFVAAIGKIISIGKGTILLHHGAESLDCLLRHAGGISVAMGHH